MKNTGVTNITYSNGSSVSVSHDSVTVCQNEQYQDISFYYLHLSFSAVACIISSVKRAQVFIIEQSPVNYKDGI